MTPTEIRPTFIHALKVFVSFTPLLFLYKKDCSFVKASWTKKTMLFFETGPTRFVPESLRRGKRTGPDDGFDRSRGLTLLQNATARRYFQWIFEEKICEVCP
jgi:hypothetical protein